MHNGNASTTDSWMNISFLKMNRVQAVIIIIIIIIIYGMGSVPSQLVQTLCLTTGGSGFDLR